MRCLNIFKQEAWNWVGTSNELESRFWTGIFVAIAAAGSDVSIALSGLSFLLYICDRHLLGA